MLKLVSLYKKDLLKKALIEAKSLVKQYPNISIIYNIYGIINIGLSAPGFTSSLTDGWTDDYWYKGNQTYIDINLLDFLRSGVGCYGNIDFSCMTLWC